MLKRRSFLLLCLAASLLCVAPAAWHWRTYFNTEATQQNVKLPSLPPLAPRDRLLIVSPHLDDETLGAGGIMAGATHAKIPVRVVFLTNGDGSGATILSENFSRFRRTSYVEMAQMRQREAIRALSQLGVKREQIVFLGFPDGSLQTLWQSAWQRPTPSRFTGLSASPYALSPTAHAPYNGAQLLQDLTRAINEFRPTQILTTHAADRHPDHWSAWSFSNLALQVLATQQNATWARQTKLLGFLVHHGVWPLPHGFHPNSRLVPPQAQMQQNTHWSEVRLSANEEEQKRRALEEYGSQLVFTPNYLRAFVRSNELLGKVGAQTLKSLSLWHDEANDNSGGNGSDLRDFALLTTPNGCTFALHFAEAPRADESINIVWHTLKNGRVVSHSLQVLAGSAMLSNGRKMKVKHTDQGLEIPLLWPQIGQTKPEALLFSVQVLAGARVIEQSETAVQVFTRN